MLRGPKAPPLTLVLRFHAQATSYPSPFQPDSPLTLHRTANADTRRGLEEKRQRGDYQPCNLSSMNSVTNYHCRQNSLHSLRPNTNKSLPAAIATYCLPSTA